MRAELRYVLAMSGAQFVMTTGEMRTPLWSVVNWDILRRVNVIIN